MDLLWNGVIPKLFVFAGSAETVRTEHLTAMR